jgi:hypothetical protein
MHDRTQSKHTTVPESWGDWRYSLDSLSNAAGYEINFNDGYVEVRHLKSFALTASVAEAIWDEVLAVCRMRNCKSVLRVGPLPIRTMTASEVAAAASRLDIPGLKVAYCWDECRPDRINALFASQAMENEVTVRFFCDPDAALEWLKKE